MSTGFCPLKQKIGLPTQYMKAILILTTSIMVAVLGLAGCAFDKLNLSVDKGTVKYPAESGVVQ